VAKADVVLDCTDNMVTRQAINAACVALDTPLVTASAVGFGGQLMVLAVDAGLLSLPVAG
jgi:sulfur carrier protein ThiS adenylyltransferase